MSTWQEKAAQVIAERDAKIPASLKLDTALVQSVKQGDDIHPLFEKSGLLTPAELEITDLSTDATEIVSRLASGKVTAVEVTTAFCKRAAIAQQLINCLVDFFPDEALERAKELDAYYAEHKKPIGPLHGLPISIKGHVAVKGKDSGAGCSILAFAGKYVAKEHAPLVQILYDAGAVLYCKTTVPQSIMHLETDSFWGPTKNPYNTATTPGGSSGGESALISAGGSPMGVGGDIGGSLRGPAALCGLWTIRATTFRMPQTGGTSAGAGETIKASNGPICRSLRDVDLFCSVMLGAKPWLIEPSLVALPWQNKGPFEWKGANGKIRVGVMRDDGLVRPLPPMARALDEVAAALEKSDAFEVVEYTPYKHDVCVALAHECYFTDGGDMIRKVAAMSGEPILPLTEWVISKPEVHSMTQHELWELIGRREKFRMDYMAHWNAQNVDVVLCPATAGPAPALGTTRSWTYTASWNLTDYPSTVFYCGIKVDSAKDAKYPQPTEYRQNDYEAWVHENYKKVAELSEGLPIGLQVVGSRFTDEKVLAATAVIEKAYHANK